MYTVVSSSDGDVMVFFCCCCVGGALLDRSTGQGCERRGSAGAGLDGAPEEAGNLISDWAGAGNAHTRLAGNNRIFRGFSALAAAVFFFWRFEGGAPEPRQPLATRQTGAKRAIGRK
ncbi:hypothetical protein BOTBODRAFT_273155 [Botryobasidium botryosum FD-172 SS1]|uniref:Uncharacterized protein n=1 Tax=Botryobasidium botryosum (strain FD-172 SS1) TaxID=930990 RepID=A0A067MM99_BOTB1|nr:hypothetical protein BOTBODRAFT_273155 [Botryobasidium botryosum FD-172 SS1]